MIKQNISLKLQNIEMNFKRIILEFFTCPIEGVGRT